MRSKIKLLFYKFNNTASLHSHSVNLDDYQILLFSQLQYCLINAKRSINPENFILILSYLKPN